MVCVGCLMTDKGAPNNFPKYLNYECWATTDLMEENGALLTGIDSDMRRSKNRLKTKLPGDGPGKYSGHSVAPFAECSMAQKMLVLYHKLFRFLYRYGRKGVRIALPACCVLRIQNSYSDPIEAATMEESFIEDTFDNGLSDEDVKIDLEESKSSK